MPRPNFRALTPPLTQTLIQDDQDIASDLVPGIDQPLTVAFLTDQNIPVVLVRGIGRYQGAGAAVAHVLKKPFDEDRAKGFTPDDHRYLAGGDVGKALKASKDGVDQRVSRLRRSIALDYTAVFGLPPKAPLLIQARKAKGYRLDPEIRITKE